MNYKQLEDFKARWPLWFAEIGQLECGDGWHALIWDLCEKLEAYDPGPGFYIRQIKEKFGGLRFYITSLEEGKYEQVYKLIQDAEHLAEETCEDCGQPGKIRSDRYWIKTLCNVCYINSEVKP